jgi:hypothetical protein
MKVIYFIPTVIIDFKRHFLAAIKPNEDKHEENIFERLHLRYELSFFTVDICNLFLNVIKYDLSPFRMDCYCNRNVDTSTQGWANEREFLCIRKYNFAESKEWY